MTIMLLPLPQQVQQSLVNTVYSALQNQQIKVGLIFAALIVSMMFIDAAKTSFPKEGSASLFSANSITQNYPITKTIGQSIWDVRSKKFYAHRNLYITGAVIFLMIAIYFDTLLLESIVVHKDKLVELAGLKGSKGTSSVEYEKLEQTLKQRETDVATLEKQVDGLNTELQRKADAKKPVKTESKKDE